VAARLPVFGPLGPDGGRRNRPTRLSILASARSEIHPGMPSWPVLPGKISLDQGCRKVGRSAGRGERPGHRYRVLEQVKDRTVLVHSRRKLLVAFGTFRSAHGDLDTDR
jgi:hypothetical protein